VGGTFNSYYQSELTFVRELGRLYAEINPSLAGMLAERSSDPDVERLIEGFAFLTARIRERIDDSVPEIIHSLTELLLPHYLRPIPASSILELQPIAGSLRKRQQVPKHTEVGSRPVQGTSCRFRTTADLDVLPIAISEVKLEDPNSSRPSVRVTFDSTAKDARNEVFQKNGIRLFIHGETAAAPTFFLWMMRYLESVTIRGVSRADAVVRLSRDHVRAAGLGRDSALLPWPNFSTDGYRVLQEYFTLPQKFLFFDVFDLDQVRDRITDDKFEIIFQFGPRGDEGDPPKLASAIGKTFLRLHCVPIVNLFTAPADPIRRQPESGEQLLRATGIDPRHAEIYQVESVNGGRQGRTKPKTYHPFYSFAHTAGAEYYCVRRLLSPLNDGLDTYLSIVSPRDVAPDLAEREVLSIQLTCTNRSLPAELSAGDVSVSTPSSPTFATFKNITGVTKALRPPLGSELQWRLIAHLGINRRSLTDEGIIASLLSLYDFSGSSDEHATRASRLKIEAIRGVETAEATRLVRGAPVRGVRTTVSVEESGFTGPGDAFLFGTMLDELLSSHVAMNSFNELALRLTSGRAFRWTPRSGVQKVL
jgi:type VI secretion system protein ImpG